MGFLSIAEQLELEGYHVRIVNLAYRMLMDTNFDAEAFFRKLKAPLFGIDLHWMVHAHGAIEIAKLVKKHHPESKVIFGGYTATYYYKELIACPEVDFVMRGDSTEAHMKKLMASLKDCKFSDIPNLAWKDAGGCVHENPLAPAPTSISDIMLNQYSGMIRRVLRYHDLKSAIPYRGWMRHMTTTVFTVRGCNHNCVLCGASRTALKNFSCRERGLSHTGRYIQ
jgi:radical SAM superfamily enzyme YgiQ (UPF0313 family)